MAQKSFGHRLAKGYSRKPFITSFYYPGKTLSGDFLIPMFFLALILSIFPPACFAEGGLLWTIFGVILTIPIAWVFGASSALFIKTIIAGRNQTLRELDRSYSEEKYAEASKRAKEDALVLFHYQSPLYEDRKLLDTVADNLELICIRLKQIKEVILVLEKQKSAAELLPNQDHQILDLEERLVELETDFFTAADSVHLVAQDYHQIIKTRKAEQDMAEAIKRGDSLLGEKPNAQQSESIHVLQSILHADQEIRQTQI